MDSRERTFLAIERQQPDRIPIDFWASDGFKRKLRSGRVGSIGEYLDEHDVDLRYVDGPVYVGPPLPSLGPGFSIDIWGVIRRTAVVELKQGIDSYQHVDQSPLAGARTVEDVENYPHWPNVNWFNYDVVETQCDQIRRNGRVVVFEGDRLNRVSQLKPAMYLRGMEQLFVDLVADPAIADAILTKIKTFYVGYLERILDAANGKIDIVLTGDDFGSQRALLISPQMWERFLRQGFAQYIDVAKSYGAKTMHHTCGSVEKLIPAMIECGLDVLQSIQPEAASMSPQELKDHFGDNLAFHGGVSIQQTMPFGSSAEIRREVKRLARTLGRAGGYVFCTAHNIQADTPVESVDVLMEAYRDYGAYS